MSHNYSYIIQNTERTCMSFTAEYALKRYTIGTFGGYMQTKIFVVFYVWLPDIFISFYIRTVSDIVYSMTSNTTLLYHTIGNSGARFAIYNRVEHNFKRAKLAVK